MQTLAVRGLTTTRSGPLHDSKLIPSHAMTYHIHLDNTMLI